MRTGFSLSVATGRAERDPSGDLRGARPPASVKHMATITDPKKIVGLLRSIDRYRGSIVTRCALQLAPLVFVHPGELRQAEWSEFNLDAAEWRIPAEKIMPERKRMMQAWADYLEGIKAGAKIIPFRAAG